MHRQRRVDDGPNIFCWAALTRPAQPRPRTASSLPLESSLIERALIDLPIQLLKRGLASPCLQPDGSR